MLLDADVKNATIAHEPTKKMTNVNLRNGNLETPLHLAAENGIYGYIQSFASNDGPFTFVS